jgi:hypothetical protein
LKNFFVTVVSRTSKAALSALAVVSMIHALVFAFAFGVSGGAAKACDANRIRNMIQIFRITKVSIRSQTPSSRLLESCLALAFVEIARSHPPLFLIPFVVEMQRDGPAGVQIEFHVFLTIILNLKLSLELGPPIGSGLQR